MEKIVNKKNIYLLGLFVICLLGIVIVPTYAKFGSSYTTEEDVVGLNLSFNLSITNIEEYEEIVIPAGSSEKFNVEITNITGDIAYYGVWYMLVEPNMLSSDMQIGKLAGSTTLTTDSIENTDVATVSIGVINNSDDSMKIYIGVGSSNTSTSDIEYLGGKYLITGEVEMDNNEPNAPNLNDSALIPVYYNDTDDTWRKADSDNINYSWYNYEEKRWANAILISDDSKRETYLNATIGSVINESDIIAFYVWIPRYKYRVWNINRQSRDENTYAYSAYKNGIEIKWENWTDSTGNVECNYNVSTLESDNSLSDMCIYNETDVITVESDNKNYNDAWYTHPAFTFGEEEKTGFWIGKFEMTGNTNLPSILPDNVSISGEYVHDMFSITKKIQSYGLSNNIDAHMMTNLEWGAISYLTRSIYGLCDGKSCKDVYSNNSNNSYTGRSVGTLNDEKLSKYGTYNYKGYLLDDLGNVTKEKNISKVASTTGNITGVYDMVGGSGDVVLSNMVNLNGNLSLKQIESNWNDKNILENKYYNSYSYGTNSNNQKALNRSRLGDAIGEILDDSTDLSFVNGEKVWIVRGGGSCFNSDNQKISLFSGSSISDDKKDAQDYSCYSMRSSLM